MKREQIKLDRTLGGIRDMTRTPSAVWIVDTNKEHLAVEEARKLRIPIIGILDTNCDPDEVDFPIPGNDDAIRAVGLLTRVVADAVAEGLLARSGAKTGDEATGSELGSEEPLAAWERELLEGETDKAKATPQATTGAEATGDDAAKTDAAKTDAAKTDTSGAEATGAAADSTEAPDAAVKPVETPAEAVADAPIAPVGEATPGATAEEPVAEAPVVADAETVSEQIEPEVAETVSEPKVAEAATGGPYGADSAVALEDGSAPAGFDIKGNKSSMKFHAPSSSWYDRTNAEVWFRTAEAAEKAGFVNAES